MYLTLFLSVFVKCIVKLCITVYKADHSEQNFQQ